MIYENYEEPSAITLTAHLKQFQVKIKTFGHRKGWKEKYEKPFMDPAERQNLKEAVEEGPSKESLDVDLQSMFRIHYGVNYFSHSVSDVKWEPDNLEPGNQDFVHGTAIVTGEVVLLDRLGQLYQKEKE